MAGERIRIPQIRWAKSLEGPWGAPCIQDGTKLTDEPASDWSKPERHPIFRGMFEQRRVVEAVIVENLPAWHDRPNANGEWLRARDGKTQSFEVSLCSETGDPPLSPHVWSAEFGNLLKLDGRLVRPGDRWYGPIPEDK